MFLSCLIPYSTLTWLSMLKGARCLRGWAGQKRALFQFKVAECEGRRRDTYEACTKIPSLSLLSPPSTSFYSRPVLGKHFASSPRV